MHNSLRKIKRLRKARCTAVLVLLIIIGMLLFGGFDKANGVDTGRPMNSVVVCRGDTLWNLVQEHYAYDGDIRKAVYEVKQLNGLKNAYIIPGQVLQIPQW